MHRDNHKGEMGEKQNRWVKMLFIESHTVAWRWILYRIALFIVLRLANLKLYVRLRSSLFFGEVTFLFLRCCFLYV